MTICSTHVEGGISGPRVRGLREAGGRWAAGRERLEDFFKVGKGVYARIVEDIVDFIFC